jgi:tetratricopeptide (TPR) repeat protein
MYAPATPRPARAPRPMIAADVAPEPPLPPQTPRPAAAPMTDMAPMPPMPPMPPMAMDMDQDIAFRMQEKAWAAQERAFEIQERAFEKMKDFKFDHNFDFKFDLDHQIAAATDSLAKMKFDMPFAYAPQVVNVNRMKGMSEDSAYTNGQRALEGRRYTEALEYFNQVASRAGNRADGALYWKAYTLIKLGRADEARAAIAELRKTYASSRWLDDAKALEVEAGKPVTPESESDEELKLIALNGLMQSDPDRAFPLLESLLKSAQPPRIRRQAVFVLAQSNSPKAQTLLEQVAKGQGNPDLQLSAIRYLGEKRRQGGSNPVLNEIYSSTNDQNVKRAVLQAFENARDKDRLLAIAKSEQNQELRMHAIRMLGSMQGAQADMWALFQAEQTAEGKQAILESMPSAGNQDKMLEVARTEKDPKVRRFAIHNLGSTRAATTGDSLAQLYASEQDPEVKRAILDSLAGQRNAKALVSIARSEKDTRMQQRIIERLVSLKTPEGNDYLMEILKK